MKNSPSVGQLGELLGGIFKRYHVITYTLTIVIAVSVAIFMLNGVIAASGKTYGVEVQVDSSLSIDTATIEKAKSFTAANEENRPFVLPGGRINPFVE